MEVEEAAVLGQDVNVEDVDYDIGSPSGMVVRMCAMVRESVGAGKMRTEKLEKTCRRNGRGGPNGRRKLPKCTIGSRQRPGLPGFGQNLAVDHFFFYHKGAVRSWPVRSGPGQSCKTYNSNHSFTVKTDYFDYYF